MRWMIGTNPIFMYCALCSRTIFYPLDYRLFKTNLCFRCGGNLLWKQILRKHIFCRHNWMWVGCAGGGSIAVLKERIKRLPFNIQFHEHDPARQTEWYICQKCSRVKKLISTKKHAIELRKLAQEMATQIIAEGGI